MKDEMANAGSGPESERIEALPSGFASPDEVVTRLREMAYLADGRIGMTVFLADRLEKPVLVEGPAGVGKTELARSVALATGARLIRLQCYEGLDESKALYEWNYKKQLLRIQADDRREPGPSSRRTSSPRHSSWTARSSPPSARQSRSSC